MSSPRRSRPPAAAVGARTSIDGRRLLGEHVGTRPAGDEADVDRDAAWQVLQRLDGQDLPRQLADGADALARDRRPRAPRSPRVTTSNSPHPLRLVLTAPPGSAGSSTSTASLCARLGFHQRARRPAPGLLVGGPQHDDAPPSGTRGRRARGRPACRGRCRPSCRTRRGRAGVAVTPLSGMRASWPIGHTVSKCPSSRTWRSRSPNSARRWSPAAAVAHARRSHAGRCSSPREFGAAAVDGGLVVGRRLDG